MLELTKEIPVLMARAGEYFHIPNEPRCMRWSTQECILNIKQVLKRYQDPIVQEKKTYAIAEVPLLTTCVLRPT